MNIYSLDNIDELALQSVGGKAKGLYLLCRCGLNVPKGFCAVDAENDIDLQVIADYYENSSLGAVAVRSSAAAEDGADFSSAGQYETFLNVRGKNEVKKAVRDCIGSLGNTNAAGYSSYFSAAKSARMCVVVQEMVEADAAGVCFTKEPGGEGMLIEAVEGIGESLVSGKRTAHIYRLSENTSNKGDSLLDAGMIGKIAAEARRAKEAFGYELDMEWAVKDGCLYWLQARPITVTDNIDAFELDAKDITDSSILTTCNVGEMLPGAVTPLSISTSVASIDYGMRKMIVKAGAAKSFEDIPKGSCVTNFGNHLFINISALYAIGDAVIGATREGVEMSLCGRILENVPSPPVPKVSKLSKINNARKYFGILLGCSKACKSIKALAEASDVLICNNVEDQIKEISSKLWLLDEAFWLHYITSAYSGSMSSAIFLILMDRGLSADDAKAAIAGVLEDIEGIESVDILRSLKAVAKALISENPQAASYSAEQLSEYLSGCGNETRRTLDEFLNRHGHRAIREAELRSMSWHSDTLSLCNYLKSVVSSGAEETVKDKNAESNIEKLLAGQKGILRFVTKYIITQARKGVVFREYTKSMSIKITDKFKTAYRNLAELMKETGLLPDSDLVFFLTHEELCRLAGGEAAIVKKAVARRRVFEEQKQFRFKEVCVGRPVPISIDFKSLAGGKVLAGSTISRGKATGKARVVKSVEEANMLQKGEIMVAKFTDIGWSPYYCMLGALVTEVGSALSHGAVVAREYALPLVANVPFATEVIKTGDVISVDGNTGQVSILG